MRYLIPAVSIPLLLLASPAWGGGPNLNEGEWEITTSMEIPGMPQAAPPMSFRQCMRQQSAVPKQQNPNDQCKMVDQDIDGDTLTWKVRCENAHGRTDIEGTVTYSGDSMQGETRMITSQTRHGGEMVMKTRMQGRRIGPCTSGNYDD